MRPEDRRDAILNGAYDAFIAHGYRKASLADIAARAGVSRSTLYLYAPDREGLFVAVAARLHERTRAAIVAADATDVPARQAITGICRAVLDAHHDVASGPHAVELLTEHARRCADLVAETDALVERRLRGVLRRARGAGEITAAGTDLSTDRLVAVIRTGLDGLRAGTTPPHRWAAVSDDLATLVVG